MEQDRVTTGGMFLNAIKLYSAVLQLHTHQQASCHQLARNSCKRRNHSVTGDGMLTVQRRSTRLEVQVTPTRKRHPACLPVWTSYTLHGKISRKLRPHT